MGPSSVHEDVLAVEAVKSARLCLARSKWFDYLAERLSMKNGWGRRFQLACGRQHSLLVAPTMSLAVVSTSPAGAYYPYAATSLEGRAV